MNKDMGNIIHQMPNGVLLVDIELKKVILANQECCQLLTGKNHLRADSDQLNACIEVPNFTKFDMKTDTPSTTDQSQNMA